MLIRAKVKRQIPSQKLNGKKVKMVKSLNVRLLVAGDCEEVSKPITILAPPFNYPSLFAPTQIAKTNKVRE